MNIQEAKQQTIFYVQDGSVTESNMYDYLNDYGQGDDRLDIEEDQEEYYVVNSEEFNDEDDAIKYCEENEIDPSNIKAEMVTMYSVVQRYHPNYGRKIKSKQSFGQDQEAAEERFIHGLEWYASEKNWYAPQYFYTHEEAEAYRVEMGAEKMGVDQDVFLHIERKKKIIDDLRLKKDIEISNKWYAVQEVVFNRYCDLISKIDGETYKETEARLAAAMPEQIHGSTFHKIIKHIRK